VAWSAAKSLGLDGQRWPTATGSRDSTGPVGCNEARRRSAEAVGHRGGLGFVADALLPLSGLPAGLERTKGRIHTMGDACRQQGRARRQKLRLGVHAPLVQGATADQVVAQFVAKQRGRGLVPAAP
jgi:hypothetical protein